MLRYKGKPDRGSNRQVDKLRPLCFCKFVAVGQPMDARKCDVHGSYSYTCDRCHCLDYRPNAVKTSPDHWPICVCGHIAQDHN